MKINIRAAEPGDYKAIRRIFDSPRAVAGTLQIPYTPLKTWRALMSNQPPNGRILLAEVRGKVVGQIGIHPVPRARRAHAATLGMAVRDEWHGRGIGTALMREAIMLADDWLHLLRLELTVYTDNEPGIRLYRKFGFVIEGTHRLYALREGEYVDTYSMARLHPNPPRVAVKPSRRKTRSRRRSRH
ncbi:MAG TPA: GNAT family N-acetyltransferase [Burkholderiales bacterium]|nr:GNAT family N-acetyltransferase [Burkholderiales bacterium]